jgi:hypothetical protein
MGHMKRLFEDLLEIQRLQRSQPEGIDLPTILHIAAGERKEFRPDPDMEEVIEQKARDARAEDREFLGIR